MHHVLEDDYALYVLRLAWFTGSELRTESNKKKYCVFMWWIIKNSVVNSLQCRIIQLATVHDALMIFENGMNWDYSSFFIVSDFRFSMFFWNPAESDDICHVEPSRATIDQSRPAFRDNPHPPNHARGCVCIYSNSLFSGKNICDRKCHKRAWKLYFFWYILCDGKCHVLAYKL